jgi:hypothetical protein
MKDFNLFGSLGQASENEVGEVFRSFIRSHVRSLICGVMAEEVAMVCGSRHQPADGEYFRSGAYQKVCFDRQLRPKKLRCASPAKCTTGVCVPSTTIGCCKWF